MSVLVGCGSSRQASATAKWTQKGSSSKPSGPILPALDKSQPSGRLIAEAESWLGVPYKYGGTDRNGVDCSGFVLQVYQRALGISMPRNSKAQKEFCAPASKSELLPGDLVFFATGRDRGRVSHVGIFLGDDRMIHASTNGVVVSDITVPYYTRTFAGAGFVGDYRAMIDKKKKGKPDSNLAVAGRKKKRQEETESRPAIERESRQSSERKPETVSQPIPEPCPEPQMPPEMIPAINEPATTQSEPVMMQPAKPEPQPEKDPRPEAEPAVTPIPIATQAPAIAEPSAEEARSAVLSNLIEKKLTQQ